MTIIITWLVTTPTTGGNLPRNVSTLVFNLQKFVSMLAGIVIDRYREASMDISPKKQSMEIDRIG
jgi:hypothetical protein